MANDEDGLNIGNMMGMMMGMVMLSLVSSIMGILPQPKGNLEITSLEIS